MGMSFEQKRLDSCRKQIGRINPLEIFRTQALVEKTVGQDIAETLPPFIIAALAALWSHHPASFLHSISMARRAVVYVVTIGARQTKWGQALIVGALIHDLGKLGVPSKILSAPRKLTETEEKVMNQHPSLMFELVGRIMPRAARIAIQHHEHGGGRHRTYPRARRFGEDVNFINLRAETPWIDQYLGIILSVIDVVDALREPRAYRNNRPLSDFQILKEIRKVFGPHYVETAKVVLAHKPAHSPLD